MPHAPRPMPKAPKVSGRVANASARATVVDLTAGAGSTAAHTCEVAGCGARAQFGTVRGGRPQRCKTHKDPAMVDVKRPRCDVQGCNKSPSYGRPTDASRVSRCRQHADPDMVFTRSRTCDFPVPGGCHQRARFAAPGWPPCRCRRHCEEGMVQTNTSRCQQPGCEVVAAFGPLGKRPTRCMAHADPDHVHLSSRMCTAPGCRARARFFLPGTSTATACRLHAAPGMVSTNKHCSFPGGCEVVPWFGLPGQPPSRCGSHRLPGMANTSQWKCHAPGCESRARFGVLGHRPTHCAAHACKNPNPSPSGGPDAFMIPHPRRQCRHPRCRELGMYEYNGDRHCAVHAPPGASSLAAIPCAGCGLPDVLTNGKCKLCDPEVVARIRHAKEERVAVALAAADIPIAGRDVVLEGSQCVMARPDFQVLGREGAHWVYVECDEWQHRHIPRECEVTRMRNLAEARGQPVVFIRFNPDGYTTEASHDKRPVPQPRRHQMLVDAVREAVRTGPRPGDVVSALWLFYDGFDARIPTWTTVVASA